MLFRFRFSLVLLAFAKCTAPTAEEDISSAPEVRLIQPINHEPTPLELNIPASAKMQLKGNVKKIEEHYFSATLKNNAVTKKPLQIALQFYQDSRFYFDEAGRLVKHELLNGSHAKHKTQYKYDAEGKLIKQIDIVPSDKSLVYEQNLFYNEQGILIKRVNTFSNMHQSVHLFSTDSAHHHIAERTFTDGVLISKKSFDYSASNQLTQITTYVPPDTDTVLFKTQYRHNEHQLLDEVENEVNRIKFSYDTAGNLIRCEEYSVIGNTLTGRETYSYTFDNKGNWTKKIIYVDGVPYIIVERVLTYF